MLFSLACCKFAYCPFDALSLNGFFWEIYFHPRVAFIKFCPTGGRRIDLYNAAGRHIVDKIVGKSIGDFGKGGVVPKQHNRMRRIGQATDDAHNFRGKCLVNIGITTIAVFGTPKAAAKNWAVVNARLAGLLTNRSGFFVLVLQQFAHSGRIAQSPVV